MPMSGVLIASGGFLCGVLWMDLLFDTQIFRLPPTETIGVIVTYYENATLRAFPMNRLIGLTMIATVLGATYQLIRGGIDRRVSAVATTLAGIAVGLALTRIVPNAMLLGSRAGPIDEQIALARGICLDHAICLVLMLGFVVTQILGASGPPPFGRMRNRRQETGDRK